MGAQSLVIGKMFGEGFQYGKRKISAMPNEEFNKLTFEMMMSNARDEMKASIPTMQQAMRDMQPMVETVIHEFMDYLGKVLREAPVQAAELGKDIFGNIPAELVEFQKRLEDLYKSFGLPMPGIRAYADTGTNIPLSQSSTVKGLSVSQAREQARLKQVTHEAEVERLRVARVNLSTQVRQTLSVAGPQVRQGITQKAAGQSQRNERTRLINIINKAGKDLKNAMTQGGDTRLIQRFSRTLAEHQQQLVNLLARYRF